jgi:NAD(P)-dependent dehydrogenase (short-subunit alcohol dehydrogenase family)
MKTWFITGASRGFGRIWAEAALKRGDRVAVTARKLADIDVKEHFGETVLPLALDVTDSDEVARVVRQAQVGCRPQQCWVHADRVWPKYRTR